MIHIAFRQFSKWEQSGTSSREPPKKSRTFEATTNLQSSRKPPKQPLTTEAAVVNTTDIEENALENKHLAVN